MQRVKRFLMPCGLCATVAAVPLIRSVSSSKDAPPPIGNETQEKKLIRPSQLPIYVSDGMCSQPKACANECSPTVIEEGFGSIRRGIQGLLSEYSSVTENFNGRISTGYEHSLRNNPLIDALHKFGKVSNDGFFVTVMLDYLREESNIMPRLGAVGIGGLTGLVFSLRGGKFKRLVYTSTGALSVAAVCYPKQAQDTFTVAKHYANIGYNFIYGVKPDDANQLEIKWPEMLKINIPSSASELFNLAVDTGSSIASAFGKAAAGVVTENTESKTIAADSKRNN